MNKSDERIIKGEDSAIKILLLDSNGVPMNLTGQTLSAALSDWESGSTINGAAAACAEADSDADFRAGVVNAVWTDTETAAMNVSKNRLEVKITDGSGNITKVVAAFAVYVQDSVT